MRPTCWLSRHTCSFTFANLGSEATGEMGEGKTGEGKTDSGVRKEERKR
jgi:hypothetical protein